jgi:integrase-like protein
MYIDLLDRRVLPILGPTTKVAAITPIHLRTLIDKLNARSCSGAYVHQHVRALSSLLRFAVRRGIIEHNPVRLLDRGDRPSAKRTKEPNYLDLVQAERLLAELPDLWRPVAALCLYAALRIGEALAIRWCDLNFEAGVVHVPGTKTEGSRADVPMAAPLRTELEAHRRRAPGVGGALVFRTASGRPQERHNAARAIRAAGARGGTRRAEADLAARPAPLVCGAAPRGGHAGTEGCRDHASRRPAGDVDGVRGDCGPPSRGAARRPRGCVLLTLATPLATESVQSGARLYPRRCRASSSQRAEGHRIAPTRTPLPLHTRGVAGSIPAGPTTSGRREKLPREALR